MNEDDHLEAAYEQRTDCEDDPAENYVDVEEDACQICNEANDEETGLFWDPETQNNIIAHSDCALAQGMIPA